MVFNSMAGFIVPDNGGGLGLDRQGLSSNPCSAGRVGIYRNMDPLETDSFEYHYDFTEYDYTLVTCRLYSVAVLRFS